MLAVQQVPVRIHRVAVVERGGVQHHVHRRYDDERDPAAPGDTLRGEGKKQLSAQARSYEALRERAGAQDSNFDYSEVAFQLAIVLGSVAILALSRKVLYLSIGLGVIGAVLMINGFALMFELPF